MNNKIKIFLTLFFVFFVKFASAELYYPIAEMSKVDCRFQDFSTLWWDCKMQLPILNTKDYTKYKNDYSLYRRVYTVLWWSTYNYGWDVGNWGHQGVDIATAKWTPVYAITDWKIVLASNIAWRGNTVKVEHIINWRKIYANYAHLSKIDVSVWDSVKAKTKLWEVWNTWNSYWNHLHFQIDLAVSGAGPRYRSNCSEKNYDNIINSSVCFNQLNTNTIDPLLFLETAWAIIKPTTIEKPQTQKISQSWLLSREEILKMEIQEFLKKYSVKINVVNLWWNIELWKTWTFRITVTDKRTKRPFTWSFPGSLNFKYDWNRFSISPTWILQIDKWVRDFKITPKMSWKMTLSIYIWETFFKKISFWVFDTKKSIIPTSSILSISKNNVVWESKKWILYFKDNYWNNILWFKFDGNFTLTSDNKTVKFCLKKWKTIKDLTKTYNTVCPENSYKTDLTFSYSDTISWILIFDYKVLNLWANTISVSNSSKSIYSSKISWIIPNWLELTYPYYDSFLNISKLWIVTWISKWYFLQDRDLSTLDWISFVKNLLNYKLLKCGSDANCRNKYLESISSIQSEQTSKYEYFTRWEFLNLIWKYVPLNEYTLWDNIVFRDLDENMQKYAKNILKNNTWQDYFGETRYFQPKKNITRWEWAFLIDSVLK